MQRVGNYWHMLPEAAQARKAIWTAVNPHTGKRRIDEAFPMEIRAKTNDQEMMITFINGSTWQVLGSDNYNSQVGAAPIGIVFSEWALADPQAWAYMRPILAENGGWALFITTPRGRNHAATFYDHASKDPDWYCERLTADQTGVFSPELLEAERKEMISQFGRDEGEAKFMQEYYCSFDAALPGAYFGQIMAKMEKDGRITGVPYKPNVPVFPCFDFGKGMSNSTAITFIQVVGREPRAIDYYENNAGSIEEFGKMLQEKGYLYGSLILPHDADHPRLAGTGLSYADQFKQMGYNVRVLERTSNTVGDIQTLAQFLGMLWIDKEKCQRFVECLRNYHREWDDKAKIFKPTPKHDWSSHGVDSGRYAANAYLQGFMQVHSTAAQGIIHAAIDNWAAL